MGTVPTHAGAFFIIVSTWKGKKQSYLEQVVLSVRILATIVIKFLKGGNLINRLLNSEKAKWNVVAVSTSEPNFWTWWGDKRV